MSGARQQVMIVYGTRPEAVKVAPVALALRDHPEIRGVPVVTGQHQEMLDVVNRQFGIVPAADLQVFAPRQSLNTLSARVLKAIDEVFDQQRPDAVLVQGDTTSVAMVAIAAFNQQIPVIHLEAGLRSGDLSAPFPEEANRRLTSQVAALHLAPTSSARDNLLHEGIDPADIVVTGNTVIDALHMTVERPVDWEHPVVARAVAEGRRLVTVTVHRRENWGEPMRRIASAVHDIAGSHPDDLFVLPLHANPTVRADVLPAMAGLDNVVVTDPLPYERFAHLLANSHLVLSDSGGVQEEAPSLGVPVLVLRESTERPEAVMAGTVRLVGSDRARIVSEASHLLDDPSAHAAMASIVNPYGDGHATERVVAAIAHMLGVGVRIPDFGESAKGNRAP